MLSLRASRGDPPTVAHLDGDYRVASLLAMTVEPVTGRPSNVHPIALRRAKRHELSSPCLRGESYFL
jgi:hypothetical protein